MYPFNKLERGATSVQIRQTPAFASQRPGTSISMECVCTEATVSSPFYWYRWHPGGQPQNLFYSYAETITPNTEVDGFTARKSGNTHFYLESSSLGVNHTAVYYCAWSLHTDKER
ncbi:hypothetical protein chiPu_0012181 [Chiloscyllium punctatum]|uniref:Immunoglobulin V-set domain-containing protein n=1 Tax=Chiloscyllium punctatum TaxID=137246 RepID=A0A401STJ5_CHIPU|nr:hypothetical protein [Chiloscyllium punctatum]